MDDKGQIRDNRQIEHRRDDSSIDAFVLDKSIFNNVFEKDIRRVYIYKKAERLAKAVHLIAPAFKGSPALLARLDRIAVSLIDAATLPPASARIALSQELLTLSSTLALARTSGLLSAMNAELIGREAHALLGEVAAYEEPRIDFSEVPTLAALFKSMPTTSPAPAHPRPTAIKDNKGHVSDKPSGGRRDAILGVLKSKGPSYIKDISTVVRGVSEKTIQRELSVLVEEGKVVRSGERRWTSYRLAP